MSYCIATTIARRIAPQHEVAISWSLWMRLIWVLRQRGRHATRESGAFLLGIRQDSRVRITDFVLYDDLDPHALDTGIVRFNGRYYNKLWARCREESLSVVADVHVHPGSSGQSASDRYHPMISRKGHIALILPRFAALPVRRRDIGIYRYLGDKQWTSIGTSARQDFLHIGL